MRAPAWCGASAAGRRLCGACAAVLLSAAAAAAAAQQQAAPPQPLTIEADRVEIDDKAGVSTYTGDVVVDRGDVHLTCDTLRVHSAGGQVQRARCDGTPATFRRAPSPLRKEIHGHAGEIEYHLDDEHVVLVHDAFVQQDHDSFTGQHIVYYMQRDLVRAGGKGRVHITIQPRKGAAGQGQ